ncbi:hypothetical protein DL96DRAFT_1821710 [Flagelloscypha sp. PMI_526]|nr:hypothetical protein DL96DRAFT_1821710 [Flagelloscypha sp. PMI_526]
MPHLTLPAEILDMIVDWVSDFGDSQTLKQLTLTARRFVPHVQTILFENITFGDSHGRPGGFLKLLKARPNLTLLVKRLTLTRHAMQQKATVRVLRQLRNIETLVFPAGEYGDHEGRPWSHYFSRSKWPWNDLDPSVAASLATSGQYLPQLKRIIYRDLEGLPIDTILEHPPPTYRSGTSIRWNFDDNSFKYRLSSPPTWLLGPTLTHVHLATRTTGSLFRHHPSCQFLISLQSLTLEIHHMNNYSGGVGEDSLSFLLYAMETVPYTAPFDHFALILRDLRYTSPDEKKTYWNAIDTAIAKLGVATAKRPVPLKKFRVKMFGFIYHLDKVKIALDVVDVATSVEVEIDETWRV